MGGGWAVSVFLAIKVAALPLGGCPGAAVRVTVRCVTFSFSLVFRVWDDGGNSSHWCRHNICIVFFMIILNLLEFVKGLRVTIWYGLCCMGRLRVERN